VKDIDLLEIVSQVFPLIGPKDTQGEADQGPQVHHVITGFEMLAEFVDLGVTIVTSGDAVVGPCGLNLMVFDLSKLQPLLLETGLQKAAPAPAAIIIGAVGLHVDKILFSHNRFDHETQVFGNGVAIALANNLAGILHREFDFEVLVPVGIDLELALPNPFGVIFVNLLDLEVMLDVEFFQSGPD
jgi:hypothetical protein